MPVTDFNTWNRAIHFRVHHGGMPDSILRDRTLEVQYVDRAVQFDHIEWKLDNHDGMLTRPEYLATGLIVSLKLGYIDGDFPWKSFIINRLRGGVGVYGRVNNQFAIGENEAVITYQGRNRNAPGGKPSKPWSRRAKAPPKKPGKIYPPTQEFKNLDMTLDAGERRFFEGKSTSEVVKVIAASAGFTGKFALIQDTKDTLEEGLTLQQDEPLYALLSRLARQHDFLFKVEKDVFHFHHPHWSGAAHQVVERFTYGAGPDILSLDIDADFRLPIPSNVTAKSYDFKNRAINVGSLSYSKGVQQLNIGTAYSALVRDPARSQLLTRPESGLTVGSFGAVSKRAEARFIARNWNAFQINLKVVGNPKILSGRLLELAGTGSPLVDGKWYISEARHTVSHDTYITEIKLKHPPKNILGRTVITNVQDPNYDRGTKALHVGTLYHRGRLIRRISR